MFSLYVCGYDAVFRKILYSRKTCGMDLLEKCQAGYLVKHIAQYTAADVLLKRGLLFG